MTAPWLREALGQREQATLAKAVVQTDFLRGGPRLEHERGGWKEWTHFVVVTRDVRVIINWSFTEAQPGEGPPGSMVPRATLLVGDPSWDGDVERVPLSDAEWAAGRVPLRLGDHALDWDGTAWRIRMRCALRDVSVDLRVVPVTRPSATSRLPFSAADRVQWLVFPRCVASGTVHSGGRTHRLQGAACYHDHNWGRFAWGGDFAWEWGFAVPDDPDNPWSLVFSRVSDRHLARTRSLGLFLWRGSRYHQLFLESQVTYAPAGETRVARPLCVPRVTRLLRPGGALGIPRALTVTARGKGDHLVCEATIEDVLSVVIPSETDPRGTQAIHECDARMRVEGRVGGEDVSLTGPAVLEFVRG